NLPPDLRDAVLVDEPEPEGDEEALSQDQGTHFERIASFLRANGNLPHPIAAIERGTGIPRASISAVLYRTHPKEFTSCDLPGPSRAKAWQLATPEPDPFDDFENASCGTGPSNDDIPF